MRTRKLIKSQIIDAWRHIIATDYANQRINSERSLQAAFWAQLNSRLGRNRRLFIEPCLSVIGPLARKAVYPDVVVCNSREVIAVIELKYLPRVKPEYLKDMRTLQFIARERSGIRIANSRYRGPTVDSRDYAVSSNTLFVWAGVHKADRLDQLPLYSEAFPELHGCYLQLHAVTDSEAVPEVRCYQ